MTHLMVLALGLISLSGCYAGYYGPRYYRRPAYVAAPARVYVAPAPAVVVRAY